jgi:sporulation protein YlmC with PRC-barrel domain
MLLSSQFTKVALSAACLTFVVSAANAGPIQVQIQPLRPLRPVTINEVPQNAPVEVALVDHKVAGGNLRVSNIIGMNIENSQRQNVGQVSDFVINARTGNVSYVAVTYGGLLGVGDKMYAVPYEAFQWKQDPDNASHHILVLNVTKDQLEGDPGFDQDHWPDFANQKYLMELDTRYKIDRANRRRDRDVDVNINSNPNGGVNVDVNRNNNNNLNKQNRNDLDVNTRRNGVNTDVNGTITTPPKTNTGNTNTIPDPNLPKSSNDNR